jgi:chromosome segregation ATPase
MCCIARLQLAEARSQREEMLADLAALTSQASALQAEIDSRDEKMGSLEAAAEQAHSGLEAALGRLRELEGEQQQLEARVTLLQEENLELSTEVSDECDCQQSLPGQEFSC